MISIHYDTSIRKGAYIFYESKKLYTYIVQVYIHLCRKSIITYSFAFVNSFFQNKLDTLCLSFYKIQISFCRSSFLIVGTGVLDCPKGLSCCFTSFSVKFASQTFSATPTDLCDICCFGCRGDHWSSVIYKNIILFKKDRRGRRSLQICTIFVILIVGATTMFSKKTCGLPSGRPCQT